MSHHSFHRICFFSSLFSRQATEDSSSLPVPRPRVKKRLSASFPDDTSIPTDEITHLEDGSNKNINEPVLTKRKTKTEAMVHHGSSPANSAVASESEVYEYYLKLYSLK